MKGKFTLLLTVVFGLMCMSSLAFAQVNVTFQVDMKVQIGLGNFDPATQGISAVGSHNGWGGADLVASALTDADNDSVYVGVQAITNDTIDYKFVVTDAGAIAAWESSDNRQFIKGANDSTLAASEWAQGVNFKVDMTPPLGGASAATLDTATQYVAVVGTFNGWGGAPRAGSEMTDADNDNIYEGRYPVGTSDAMYKFTIRNKTDDSVASWEDHGDRSLAGVGLDPADAETVPWSGDPGAPVDVNVTFSVDLRVMKDVGLFDETTMTVQVAGSFQGWNNSDPTFDLTDGDNDFIYDGTLGPIASSTLGAAHEYKFIVKNGGVTWEDNLPGGANRMLQTVDQDVSTGTLEWNEGATFRVDMTGALNDAPSLGKVAATFDPATQFVSVAGTFNDWGGTGIGITDGDSTTLTAYMLTDSDSDNVYEGTHHVSPPEVKYKHVIVNKSNGKIATWEGHPDRVITGVDVDFKLGTPDLPVIPWDGDPGVAVTGTVLFQVDITPLKALGVFDEAEGDTLQVRGGFNGWSDSDPATSILRQSFLDPNIYELPVTLTLVPPSDQEYKFFIKFNPDRPIWGGAEPFNGWEEPGSTGGGNRIFTFTGDAQQTLDVQTFNDIFNVIPDGVSTTLNFTADMRCFLQDPPEAAGTPDVTKDTLRLDIQDAVWHFFNGTLDYHDNIFNVAGPTPFDFEDADGDSIYNLAITVTGPIQNWVQYHLNWQGFEDAAPGFSAGRRRVRYARPDEMGNYAASYQLGLDIISTEVKPLVVEDPDGAPVDDTQPCTLTSVEQIANTIPKEFYLGQNYPNPFNPSTTIEYKIKTAGEVSLILFNARGQVVQELVNEEQQPGTYKITLDMCCSKSSGVYYYMLKTPDFKQTKVMAFIK